jgi:hypothetical protein
MDCDADFCADGYGLSDSGGYYPDDEYCLANPQASPDCPGFIQTQGSTNKNFIHVKNPSKTGTQEQRIDTDLDWIKNNIDPDCAKWLSGIGAQIAGLEGDPNDPNSALIGHGTFDTTSVAAFTGSNPSQTDLPVGYAITVNDTGAFFVGSYTSGGQQYTLTVGGYAGGSSQAQILILLHELAHSLGMIPDDFGPGIPGGQSSRNDKTVMQNCGKTLNAAKNIP